MYRLQHYIYRYREKLEAFFKKTDYKKTSITVNRSYFKNNRNIILVNIAANYKTGATEATQIVLSLDNRPPKMKKKRLNIKEKTDIL